jgi:hypothetical protein
MMMPPGNSRDEEIPKVLNDAKAANEKKKNSALAMQKSKTCPEWVMT